MKLSHTEMKQEKTPLEHFKRDFTMLVGQTRYHIVTSVISKSRSLSLAEYDHQILNDITIVPDMGKDLKQDRFRNNFGSGSSNWIILKVTCSD